MSIEKIRGISNPYHITHRLDPKEFVGREDPINQLDIILDEYNRTAKLKNMVITGEKAVGKSALLNRYKQILEDNNFVVVELELPIDPNKRIEEFEYIKLLIDELFSRFGGKDGFFFDSKQSDIWFSLTSGSYEDKESNYINRELRFATKYASKKRGYEEEFTHSDLERDFEKIINELISPEAEINGLAILIDEFQEFYKNPSFMDILRIVSEKLTGFMIIGAGIPTLIDSPSFEKFSRISITVRLDNMDRKDILELIFRPVETNAKLSRYEVEKYFDKISLMEITNRSDGNPLHVKLLCEKMFEHFQKTRDLAEIVLNREVMDQVMNYYANLSNESNIIRLCLQNLTEYQLEAFTRLYYYEGFSIRGVIFAELAFSSIQEDAVEEIRRRIIGYFEEVKDLGLFELKNPNIEYANLKNMNINMLAHVEYKFIGDAIDKLYVTYLYEDITRKELAHHSSKGYDDFLTGKLASEFGKILDAKNITDMVLKDSSIVNYEITYDNGFEFPSVVIKDLDRLCSTELEDKIKEKHKKEILSISKKHHLRYPSYLAAMLGYQGYYILMADASIRGKRRIIYAFYPVMGDIERINTVKEQIKDHTAVLGASFHEYMINIDSMYLYWLAAKPLIKIYVIDVRNEMDELFANVRRREFDSALAHAERIYKLDIRLADRALYRRVESTNNYGFCLINVGCVSEAKELFEQAKEKYTLSKINLAFVHFLEDNGVEAISILKKLQKKISKEDKASFLHLSIKHPRMSMENLIIEDPRLMNIVCWNLALINAVWPITSAAVFGFYNRVKPKGNEDLVHRRVRNWIDYYLADRRRALDNSKKLLSDCGGLDYLCRDILKDIEIFSQEI